jgi:hypothetical protein
MNEADKKAIDTISQALEPGARITRNGYAMLDQMIQHIASRLMQLASIEQTKADSQDSQQ